MGIGPNEYAALAADLNGALNDTLSNATYTDGGPLVVAASADGGNADISAIDAVLTDPTFVAQIVSDPTNRSLFHRLGGLPGIETVVGNAKGIILGDTAVLGYFTSAENAGRDGRIQECLTRQFCAVAGSPGTYPDAGPNGEYWPCNYGQENLALANPDQFGQQGPLGQFTLGSGTTLSDQILYSDGGIQACRDMIATHLNVSQTLADGGQMWIDINAFNAVVGDINTALSQANIDGGDIAIVDSALAPTCNGIVADSGFGCP